MKIATFTFSYEKEKQDRRKLYISQDFKILKIDQFDSIYSIYLGLVVLTLWNKILLME